MDTPIHVHCISFTYRSVWPWVRSQDALRSVSLTVQPGEVHALVGANGSGKSTLIKVLVGLLKTQTGEVKVLGRAADSPENHAEVAYLPEDGYGDTRLTVREALGLHAALHGVPRQEVQDRIDARLEDVDMRGFARRSLRALSKGQRRRVALAQTLLSEPALALLDEPFDGVDPVRCEELCDLLRRRASQGTTVLFSSHSLTDVERAADTVSLFAEGRVVQSGPLEEVTASPGEWSVALRGEGAQALSREQAERLAESMGANPERVQPTRRSLADLLRSRERKSDEDR